MYISVETGDDEAEKVISQSGKMYFIFGGIFGSPSNRRHEGLLIKT